jgi:hypothetical protein
MCLEVSVLRATMFNDGVWIARPRPCQRIRTGEAVAEALGDSRGRQRIVRGGRVTNSQKTARRVVLQHLRGGIEHVNVS